MTTSHNTTPPTAWDWDDWDGLELTDGTRVRVRLTGGRVQLEVTDTEGTTATAELGSASADAIGGALEEAARGAFAAEHAAARGQETSR